jgi:hypothetical protein
MIKLYQGNRRTSLTFFGSRVADTQALLENNLGNISLTFLALFPRSSSK